MLWGRYRAADVELIDKLFPLFSLFTAPNMVLRSRLVYQQPRQELYILSETKARWFYFFFLWRDFWNYQLEPERISPEIIILRLHSFIQSSLFFFFCCCPWSCSISLELWAGCSLQWSFWSTSFVLDGGWATAAVFIRTWSEDKTRWLKNNKLQIFVEEFCEWAEHFSITWRAYFPSCNL